MSFLYVVEKFATIRLLDGQIVAERKDIKTYIPIETLEGIVLIGNSNISSGCIEELLKRNLPVTFLSSSGVYYGRLDSTKNTNITKQRRQFRLSDDDDFKLKFSKNIIKAKINNQIIILRRYNRTLENVEIDKIIDTMKIYESKTLNCDSIEQLMGYEGIASKNYFAALSILINDDFKFKGRSRMPPKDEFNSVLSLAYTLLFYEIYTSVVNKGLNPYAGFMHKDRNNHPAIVSDFMEEWRAVIVDSLVLNLFNSNTFVKDDFIKNEETQAVFLTTDGVKKLLNGFEKKMNTQHNYLSSINYKISFRRSFEIQATEFGKALELENPDLYVPIEIR